MAMIPVQTFGANPAGLTKGRAGAALRARP